MQSSRRLNGDDAVDGILVQLPLPPQIDADKVLRAIDPAKDVDGFHPINVGLVATGTGGIVPCTPLGSMILLKSVRSDLSGMNAVIVGRSNIVGKPMCQLLLKENCTVTVGALEKPRPAGPGAHRRHPGRRRRAARDDPGEWIKPGAIVIDVGINRVADGAGKTRLIGDVAFAEAVDIAGAITPVPGGVGPMTIACLLRNSVDAAMARRG